MFSTRTEFATNDELIRQKEVEGVILYGKKPTTFIEKKASAIYGHRDINIIAQAKIYQTLDYILTFISNEDQLTDPKIQERIRNYIKSVTLDKDTKILLPKKLPILTLQPEQIPPYSVMLNTEEISAVNIADFEYLCFKNRIRFRYLKNSSFAMYMYQNILNYLNAASSKELEGNNMWQAKLGVLIERTNFSDYFAMQAFYDDAVTYRGVTYDTSFVPNYDVKNIEPQDPINPSTTEIQMINYYYLLDERTTRKVPTEMIGIFLTYPFKNGHYIRPTGEIVYLQLRSYNTLQSSRIAIQNLCTMNDIESAIENAARSIPLGDAIYYAVYSRNLKEQSIALLILRRLVGDILTIGEERINLPSEAVILSWSKTDCSNQTLALPPKIHNKNYIMYLELIQDIAASCNSKLGAAIMCSAYFIPEMHITEVYQKLTTDAEKYVLFTLILQDYPTNRLYMNLKKLNPTFGGSEIDIIGKYPPGNRLYSDTLVSDRLNALSEPLLLPSDVNAGVNVCTPYSCSELYEFNDPQLRDLVKFGDVELNPEQLSNFIVLNVY